MPYLYVYAGQQWKTAQWVRRLQNEFYLDAPDGYAGNEDCGQMSAWHVLSALGFYQVTPSQGTYVLGSPLFTRATISLPGGKTFTVKAPANSSRNIYIQKATLNGKREDFTLQPSLEMETEINTLRTELKEQNIRDIDNHLYSYALGSTYMDIVSQCERLGDYVMNVVEARLN